MTTNSSLSGLLGAIAAAPGTPRGLAVLELELRHRESSPLHSHAHDEAFHVLDGSLAVDLPDRTVLLSAGDGFTAPAGVPHAVRAVHGDARYLAATHTSSVAAYADFQRVAAPPARTSPEDEEEGTRAVAHLARTAGIELLGPPGASPASSQRA